MKYAYIICEQISGTQIGVCTSMEDAITYTKKLQKQSDTRLSKFPEEHYTWTQLPIIESKDLPSFNSNIGFKRTGSYTPWDGWAITPMGLIGDDSDDLLINYTDNIPDVNFEIGICGCVKFTVISSAYIPEEEILEFVKQKYEEWVK